MKGLLTATEVGGFAGGYEVVGGGDDDDEEDEGVR